MSAAGADAAPRPHQPIVRHHVYLSSNFWDGLWIIQQPICHEIQRHEPVLYVERPVSVFTVLRYPGLWRRLFSWLRGARRYSPTLRVLAPLPLFHVGHRVPWLFRLEFALQRWWILFWTRGLGTGPRVLWLDSPLYECAVARMGEALTVYHLADEVSAFPTSDASGLERLERRLLPKAGVVFAAAEQLAIDKRQWQRRTFTIWNAIDGRAYARDVAPPARLEGIPEPRAAFVGVMDAWVDLELLVLVATRLPQLQLVVVGDSRLDDQALRSRPNVHYLGRCDRLVVPAILRRCSVSLVPFRKSRLTERIVPLKVFEALAAGVRPVCTAFSIDLDELERQDLVAVGRSPDAFVAAVARALTEDGEETRARLSQFGLRQTWEERWSQMSRVIGDCLTAPSVSRSEAAARERRRPAPRRGGVPGGR